MHKARSPLTGSTDVELIRSVSTADLADRWKRSFGIDVAAEFKGHQQVHLYECARTRLRFFVPNEVAASGRVYSELEKFDWYYQQAKWEHDVAMHDLQGCQRILEIGCGTGSFIERLARRADVHAEGIELNESAARAAVAKGVRVVMEELSTLVPHKGASYDAVCAFQVLEHVTDPLGFLRSAVELLRPGGKLIIAVPNMDSFLKHAVEDLPNQPPHHITQWCEATARSLPSLLPVRLASLRCEPLQRDHVDWFISAHASRFPRGVGLRTLSRKVLTFLVRRPLRSSAALRARMRGHTLYFCLEKLG